MNHVRVKPTLTGFQKLVYIIIVDLHLQIKENLQKGIKVH